MNTFLRHIKEPRLRERLLEMIELYNSGQYGSLSSEEEHYTFGAEGKQIVCTYRSVESLLIILMAKSLFKAPFNSNSQYDPLSTNIPYLTHFHNKYPKKRINIKYDSLSFRVTVNRSKP